MVYSFFCNLNKILCIFTINLDKDISKFYSTYHVYTHLLKAQCNDLINLGVNPSIEVLIEFV